MTRKRPLPLEVIIVTQQRYSQLLECVSCICNNTQKPARLTIVDSSSNRDQKTLASISRLCRLHSIQLTLITIQDLGIAHSRNIGIKSVSSTYFAFVDDDEYVSENWCRVVCNFFRTNRKYQVLCGPKIPKNSNNYWNQTWASVIESTFSYSGLADFVPSGNSCYRTSFVREHQLLYDERFKRSGEDQAFYFNLMNLGASCYFSHDLSVRHDCRPSLVPFIKQWFSYGKSIHCFYHLYLSKGETGKKFSSNSMIKFLLSFYPFRGNRLSIKLLPGLSILNLAFLLGLFFSYFTRKTLPRS